MQVSVSHTTKIVLTELEKLDPVTIYLDNPAPSRGKITIECFGKSWSSFWPAMGGRRVEEFFVSCDDDYLAGNLSSCRSHIPVTDTDEICQFLRGRIIEHRREGYLDKDDARKYWDEAADITLTSDYCSNNDLMYDVLGDDWWLSLPEKENPDYNYLVLVIQTVREGLREYIKGTPAAAA
ncbi:hypothetical protein [Aeromonas veronii]|uniref:hypothetical protein n=1 Tax=Aeromonas veronii TaxID=654 RepID=UPI002B494EE4|nr:hypothetical protein [Aeromonas veronii]